MKKSILFLFIIMVFTFILGCQKNKSLYKYNVTFRIDSLKQDSTFFAHSYWIKGKVRVFYSVINNDDVDLHCYRYVVNAMADDSVLYQIAESHYNVVKAKTTRQDSTKIGIGNCRVARANIDNTLFQ
jgi:hypothetical protein